MMVPSAGAGRSPTAARRPAPVAVGAALAAGPRLTPLQAATSAPVLPSIAAGRPINWLEAVQSQVALAPISVDQMRSLRARPSPIDEPSIPGPYKLATAPSLPALRASRGKAAGAVTRGYRQGMGQIQKLFRWLNQSAYLVSVPFIVCLLLGLVLRNHSLMVLGATAVVLLNLGRIVAGVANLAVIPFRDSPIQGVFFLIPPLTFIYLSQNWHKVKKPVQRIVGPIVTIALVAAAFVVEPYLRGEGKPKGSIEEQAQAGLGAVKQGVQEGISEAEKLNVPELQKIAPKAEAALKSLRSGEALKSIQSGEALKSIQSSELYKSIEKRVREPGSTSESSTPKNAEAKERR
jgi:hypothetical protein